MLVRPLAYIKITIALLCLSVFFSYSINLYADGFNKISVAQAHQLSSSGEVLLIDIRSEKEWRDTGIAQQAIAISMHQQGGIQAFENDLIKLLNGKKDTPIALICAGGVRSAKMQHYLQQQGFSQVSDVTEGMLGGLFTEGWIDQDLPIKSYTEQYKITNKII